MPHDSRGPEVLNSSRIIGLQNNSNKTRVNLLIEESVKLPIGFIVGTSFITGSIIGNFLIKP